MIVLLTYLFTWRFTSQKLFSTHRSQLMVGNLKKLLKMMGRSMKCTLLCRNMWFSYWKIIESFCIHTLPNTVIQIEDKMVSEKEHCSCGEVQRGEKALTTSPPKYIIANCDMCHERKEHGSIRETRESESILEHRRGLGRRNQGKLP